MARRGENIYKRKDGRWEGRLLFEKGKYRYFYGKSYKEVKNKMRLFQEDAKSYVKENFRQTTMASELLELWLENDACIRVKPSTYESYYHCMHKHILPFFRKDTDNCINEESVLRFIRVLREDSSLANTSKKKVLTIFKIALRDVLKGNPDRAAIIELVRLPKLEVKEVEIFTVKEQRLLETAALRSKDARSLGIVLCLYTGIRLGELCALTWKDIDMENGMMSINKTVSRTKKFNGDGMKTGLVVGTPKSRNSMRKIPLPAFLLKIVEEGRLDGENEYILTGGSKPFDPRSFQKLYKKLLKENELPDHKFHAIRHTFATRGLELGIDIKTLSELLGHSSVSITLNIYAHSLLEQKKAAIEKFNTMHIASAELSKLAV